MPSSSKARDILAREPCTLAKCLCLERIGVDSVKEGCTGLASAYLQASSDAKVAGQSWARDPCSAEADVPACLIRCYGCSQPHRSQGVAVVPWWGDKRKTASCSKPLYGCSGTTCPACLQSYKAFRMKLETEYSPGEAGGRSIALWGGGGSPQLRQVAMALGGRVQEA